MVEICNRVSFISISIRSNVQVYNYLNLPILIFYKVKEGKTLNLVGKYRLHQSSKLNCNEK